MITGFNQDVAYKGKVYHVQTEDRGKANPVIETLIYVGGEILASKKTPYDSIIKEGYDEPKVAALLEQQHRRIVVDIKLGKYAKEPEEKFGESLISSRSLDEVILDYLTSESQGEKLLAEVVEQSPLLVGEKGWVQLKTVTEVTKVPIAGAVVSVRLAPFSGPPRQLFSGRTDKQGLCTAPFQLPAISGKAAVLIDVTHERGAQQFRLPVTKKGAP
jgi:hypothetical protein